MHCVSVGYLIKDDDLVKVLAPNIGDLDEEEFTQVSGVVQICARCVEKIIDLTPVS